jgi:hypothetical protein
LNAKRQPEYRTRNWIFDGGFEQTYTPVQLDWQIQSSDDVEVSRSDQAQQGKSSIQLNFGGLENVQFEGIQQETVLFPGKWRVGAFARTDGLTTDQGIAVRIVDPVQSRRLDVSTEALTGTHGWTKLERVFDVSPQTRLVRVEIFRGASSQFDNKVAGKAWIDGVELTPVR